MTAWDARWTFGDGGAPSKDPVFAHTYEKDGVYIASLEVTDEHGARSRTTFRIQVGDPPRVLITSPRPEDRYEPNSTVVLRAHADDIQDGALTGDALTWTVELHHNSHTHPYLPPTKGNDIEVVIQETHSNKFEDEYWFEIVVKAADSDGLETSAKQDFRPVLDTEITSAPETTENKGDGSFAFRANDSIASFECSLDNAAYGPCSSPHPYSGLSEGAHTFAVRAIDAVGNFDPSPASHGWTIDLPPETAITSAPSNSVASTTALFEFQADQPGRFECSLNGGPFAPCDSPKSYAGLSEGIHAFEVRAIDAGGQVDASPATRVWRVDTTPPETGITSGPSGAVRSRDATVEFESTEPGTLECSLDEEAFSPCVSPMSYSGLGEGEHKFSVRATDEAGNLDPSPALRAWEVDAAPPDAPSVVLGDGALFQLRPDFTVAWAPPADRHDVRYVQAPRSGVQTPDRDFLTDTPDTQASWNGSPGYTYCFRARAIDSAAGASPFGPASCTAVPLDHSSFRRGLNGEGLPDSWADVQRSNDHLGGFFRTRRQGAILVSPRIARDSQIALFATVCSRCGRLAVYWGKPKRSRLLQEIDLQGRRSSPFTLFPIERAEGGSSAGRLLLKVISGTGKNVMVSGLGVVRNLS